MVRKRWSRLWLVMGHPIWAQWTYFQHWSVPKFVGRGPKYHLKPPKNRLGSSSCLKSALKLWSRLWLFMGNPIWAQQFPPLGCFQFFGRGSKMIHCSVLFNQCIMLNVCSLSISLSFWPTTTGFEEKCKYESAWIAQCQPYKPLSTSLPNAIWPYIRRLLELSQCNQLATRDTWRLSNIG